jgi:hypothetical protein
VRAELALELLEDTLLLVAGRLGGQQARVQLALRTVADEKGLEDVDGLHGWALFPAPTAEPVVCNRVPPSAS